MNTLSIPRCALGLISLVLAGCASTKAIVSGRPVTSVVPITSAVSGTR